MSVAVWVSLLTLVVGTLVTLSVASMQRKQMRQIELHRANPKIPLVPPPHPVTRFLKTFGWLIFAGLLNLSTLFDLVRDTAPVTRWVVFKIALTTITGIALFFIGIVSIAVDKAMKSSEKMIEELDMVEREKQRSSDASQ